MGLELPDGVRISLDDLTLGEVEDIEDLTGLSLAAIGGRLTSGDPPMRVLRALVFVTLRRDRPDLKFEETRDIQMSALSGPRVAEPEVDADPTRLPDESSTVGQEA